MEHLADPWSPENEEGGKLPEILGVQFRMQALDLKPTDIWNFLMLPGNGFLEGWFLVRGAINDFMEAERESS